MRIALILMLGMGINMSVALANAEQSACPVVSQGETQEDCPWAGVARQLLNASREGRPVQPELEAALPELVAQIKSDSANEDYRDLWGKSINFDEGAKGIIVDPAILEAVAKLFGVPSPAPGEKVVHAGMEHTYGYLFSVLKTPFGYKRARWVRNEIEEGFGLPAGIFSPNTKSGTLFSNLTAFLGRIAFRTSDVEMRVIQKRVRETPKELRDFAFKKLRITRVKEDLEVPNVNGKVRRVQLLTDLVPFLNVKNPEGNTHLLIYTVVDPFHHGAQLISAFPVQTSFVARVADKKHTGAQTITTRYNAFVEGLSGTTLMGTRTVTEPHERTN